MLHYDYTESKKFCESIGLVWLDSAVTGPDEHAHDLGMTQEQVDAMMWHVLWHIRFLFSPKWYGWRGRIAMAWWFLFGSEPKIKKS